MRTLYQFPFSHYCEKTRWVLEHKELNYIAKNLTPGFHRIFTQRKVGINTLPVLNDENQWIGGSTKIVEYIDQQYPENNLIRSNPTVRRAIFQINSLADELGIYVGRWGLANIILPYEEQTAILLNEKSHIKKYTKPVLSLFRKQRKFNQNNLQQDEYRILSIISQLNSFLTKIDTGYFVKERLTLADISVCSMIAPLLNIKGTPWENEALNDNETVLQLKKKIMLLPLGEYVIQIYKDERNARVDWRGI